MAISNVTLDSFKTSERVDVDTDDNLIKSYISAAENYVINAIGEDDGKFYQLSDVQDLFSTAVQAMAAAYYQQRSALSGSPVTPVSLVSDSIIAQLRARYEYYIQNPEGNDDDKQTV
ncbi:head-tail connector protein [Oenococcus alcoholitolerans]|uniref:head-tail connector protein n=1 Tax=Oenococcus alcoholitolerans TaxID=931074 RepID=UPI003F6F9021